MDNARFIELGKELFTGMALGKGISELSDIIKRLRLCIYNYPENPNVKFFISTLLEFNLALFLDIDLTNAFGLLNSHRYYKQFMICQNLPYTTHRNFADFLPELLQIPSTLYSHWYETFMYLLEKYNPEAARNQNVIKVMNFVEKNPKLARPSKDEYLDIDKEIELYNKARNGEMFPELKEFAQAKWVMAPEEVRTPFMNKKIGNIGEIYAYDLIMEVYHAHFVARDAGNGYGYDILFLDDDNIENLVEVKTTPAMSEDDYFGMSDNEYEVMTNCLINPYANYIVCRVVLDSTLTHPSFILLKATDAMTLSDINNKDNKYELTKDTDGKIFFKRHNPSRAIHTEK